MTAPTMIGSVNPIAESGKRRLRGTVLLGSAALLLVHLDHDARHCLGVLSDVLDLLIGRRFRVLAEQFPTSRDRNWLRPRICDEYATKNALTISAQITRGFDGGLRHWHWGVSNPPAGRWTGQAEEPGGCSRPRSIIDTA
jgi:hypothetical protein